MALVEEHPTTNQEILDSIPESAGCVLEQCKFSTLVLINIQEWRVQTMIEKLLIGTLNLKNKDTRIVVSVSGCGTNLESAWRNLDDQGNCDKIFGIQSFCHDNPDGQLYLEKV